MCLACFDELKRMGQEAFTCKHDLYWDIAMNDNLPEPVIDLPIPGESQEADDGEFRLTGASKPSKQTGGCKKR